MNSNLAETLQMLVGFTSGIVVLISILKYKLRHKELERGSAGHFEDAAESLRMEMQDLRAEHTEQIADLQERLEFAGRLLTKGRAGSI